MGVGGGVVIDIHRNVENRGAFVMFLKFTLLTIHNQWTEVRRRRTEPDRGNQNNGGQLSRSSMVE